MLSPFNSDENYIKFKKNISQCKCKYILNNIYDILKNPISSQFLQEDNILMYIDGIDDEYCFYLANER